MKDKQKQFLSLFFNEGEWIWGGKDKYATHPSLSQDNLDLDKTVLLSLNPFQPESKRNDEGVSKYRSFLVEIDTGSLKEQKDYIDSTGMPYSACVFSGNKSLHFGIVLASDLPTDEIWRFYAQWILNVVDKADKLAKNPSRMIRFPGTIRPDTGREQSLVFINKRISLSELNYWLSQHPDKKPKVYHPKERSHSIDNTRIASWVWRILDEGISVNRNQTWFSVFFEFRLAGYSEEEIETVLRDDFIPESSFTEREWKSCMRSAIRQCDRRE